MNTIEYEDLIRDYKQCSKCKVYIPRSGFYKHRSKKDGLSAHCAECLSLHRAELLKEIQKDEVRHKKYLEGKHASSEKRKANGHIQTHLPTCREKNKHKIKVRGIVLRAVNKGSLIKLPCEVCGEPKSQAHHEDYSKPLDVIWLCRKHHSEIHRKFNDVLERIKNK